MIEDAYENEQCYICKMTADLGPDGGIRRCTCKRCGRYGYDKTEFDLHAANDDILVRLAGWIQEQNRFGIEPVISLKDFRRIKEMRLPDLRERSLSFLRLLYDQFRYPTRSFFVSRAVAEDPEWLGVTYSKDDNELNLLLRVLGNFGFLDFEKSSWSLSIDGILSIEDASRAGSKFSQGFVAMSFSEELNSSWNEGFGLAIRDAGFRPMRIDAKEFIGGISDEIISEIRASRFVVADYTQQKSGVYFEAGFALGLGLNVIPTVRSDQVCDLHFDIKHLNTITWTDPADLRAKLAKRILAVIGKGPLEA